MDGEDSGPAEEIENFYGVYLLVSQNPRYKGRTYVGFTVDPIRRLKQHNGGCEMGGARRTNNRGPWAMVLIVYGFPNMISALRFEWAWQHPQRSRRLSHLPQKRKQEHLFNYHIRLLSNMLNLGPWNLLPLNIRWLRPDLKGDVDFIDDNPPPMHMSITYGPIKAIKKKKPQKTRNEYKHSPSKETRHTVISSIETDDIPQTLFCCLCTQMIPLQQDLVTCISPKCGTASHITCLAQHFRQTSQNKTKLEYFLPVEGTCPVCDFHCLWGDIIKKKKGCYQNIPFKLDVASEDDDSDPKALEEQDI